MSFMPSIPTGALVKDVYPVNQQNFRRWLHFEGTIMRSRSAVAFPLGVYPDLLEGLMTDVDIASTHKRLSRSSSCSRDCRRRRFNFDLRWVNAGLATRNDMA